MWDYWTGKNEMIKLFGYQNYTVQLHRQSTKMEQMMKEMMEHLPAIMARKETV
jgi:hypothetical protein